jgi:predicted O-linked N-acetylglucosamine transferase (SPINDLY family)
MISRNDKTQVRRATDITRTVRAGFARHEAGELDLAEAHYRKALEQNPKHADALHLLGLVCYQQGKFTLAIELIGRALPELHDLPEAHLNLGNALREVGQLPEAIDSYQRAIALDPDYGMAHSNLARALNDQGLFKAGLESSRRAVALIPDFLGAHVNCADALIGLEHVAEAEIPLRRVIDLAPDRAEAHHDLGEILAMLGRFEEAAASYHRALAINPDYAEAHYNLGRALGAQSQFEGAEASYRRTLTLDPDHAGAHYGLANIFRTQRKLSEAIAGFERAMTLDPGDLVSLANWFRERQNICDWANYRKDESRARSALEAQASPFAPGLLLALSSTPEEQLSCARRVSAKIAVPEAAMLLRPRPRPGSRLRLGYLSADFRQHPVAALIAELIECHDRREVEVLGFCYGANDESAMRARLKSAFDRFVDVPDTTHRQAAELISSHSVDILIDLNGYTGLGRTGILAYRPAPIQVNYLGYPGTIGAEFIDYIIVDRFLVPMDQQCFYTERLVQLPNCYQPSDTTRKIAEPPSRTACGLPEEGFVFCCFNNSYKITPTFFDLWMNLLRGVPDSVLWLFESNNLVKDNLRREAVCRNISAERLVFAPWAPLPDYLACLSLADLFLDTLPYNGGATANDALWAGLPVLTCAGATYVGRMAGALLTAVGLPELITASLDEYAALALRLATERNLLTGLRKKLAANRAIMPLFDMARFTRDIEAAYTGMWEIWRAGRPPAAFAVEPADEIRPKPSRALD